MFTAVGSSRVVVSCHFGAFSRKEIVIQWPYDCGIHIDDESLDLQLGTKREPFYTSNHLSILYCVRSLNLYLCLFNRMHDITKMYMKLHARKIRSRLKSQTACYHIRSRFLSSSHLMPNKILPAISTSFVRFGHNSVQEMYIYIHRSNVSLTHILLTWTIWRAPTNVNKWRMGFNSAFKGLIKVGAGKALL